MRDGPRSIFLLGRSSLVVGRRASVRVVGYVLNILNECWPDVSGRGL